MEIEILKQKLEFQQQQLKDRELEIVHYKRIVSTLQSLMHSQNQNKIPSHRSRSPPTEHEETSFSAEEKQAEEPSPSGSPSHSPPSVRKNYCGKMSKKQVSFHNDVKIHIIEERCGSSSFPNE